MLGIVVKHVSIHAVVSSRYWIVVGPKAVLDLAKG